MPLCCVTVCVCGGGGDDGRWKLKRVFHYRVPPPRTTHPPTPTHTHTRSTHLDPGGASACVGL